MIENKIRRQLRHGYNNAGAKAGPGGNLEGNGNAHLGTSTLIKNCTVYGSMITKSTTGKHAPGAVTSLPPSTSPVMTNHSDTNKATLENSSFRALHAKTLTKELLFPVMEWPSILTGPCPSTFHRHKLDRGSSFSHYTAWLEFVYFDHDVLQAVQRGEVKGIYTSTFWSSNSGSFSAAENGTLYKNGIPFLESDIMVVFEDDTDIVVADYNTTIIQELSSMSTDLLYLGWCEGRILNPIPSCVFAYAVTRRGARHLIAHYDPCRKSIDEQFAMMAKNNWISYRKSKSVIFKSRYHTRTHNSTNSHPKKHGHGHLQGTKS